jgi:hypothetical protein
LVETIDDPTARVALLQRLRGGRRVDGHATGGAYRPTGEASPLGIRDAGGAAGGAAIADFDSLMTLIETTIAPETWDAVGGPSTMAPYRAGIHVDPAGLVRDIETSQDDRLGAIRHAALRAEDRGPVHRLWTRPTALRWVSLQRLRSALIARQVEGLPPTAAMEHLAGLTDVQYLIVQADDVLLGGSVGTIDPAAQPWPRDKDSGRVPLGLELLAASAHAVSTGRSYGCSIDPLPAGLAAAQQVSSQIGNGEIATAQGATALADALGRQRISLFDVAGDSPLAWLLVDADRHMKQLALGHREMPPGVRNYLQILEATTRQPLGGEVPSGQLLRLWFASRAKQIRRAPKQDVFELAGHPIRLVSAKEFATLRGERVQAGEDRLGAAYAAEFNQNFASIAAAYPVYDRLRGAYELTAALQLVRQTCGEARFRALLGEWTQPDFLFQPSVAVPRWCESIAARHTFTHERRRHQVYVASGGVHIDPADALRSEVQPYASLTDLGRASDQRPLQKDRWWWDSP